MTKGIFSRFKSDPLGFIQRALYKIIIGPIKYGHGADYDANRYWHDRFSRYGFSHKGAGHEGLSEEENEQIYAEAGQVFTQLCQREGLDFGTLNVLEVGPGSGFYTQLLRDLGVRRYVGVDITDVLFPQLKDKFPEFSFLKQDITAEPVKEKFDLVVIIDVIEHIVTEEKLSSAMQNVKDCLSKGATVMLSPVMNRSKRHLFYVRWWSLHDIKRQFPGYVFGELVPFGNGNVLTITKPK